MILSWFEATTSWVLRLNIRNLVEEVPLWRVKRLIKTRIFCLTQFSNQKIDRNLIDGTDKFVIWIYPAHSLSVTKVIKLNHLTLFEIFNKKIAYFSAGKTRICHFCPERLLWKRQISFLAPRLKIISDSQKWAWPWFFYCPKRTFLNDSKRKK